MIEQTLTLGFLGGEPAADSVEKVGDAQANSATGEGAVKSKKPKKPRSETNRENYLKRMSRDIPVKLWLSPEAFKNFEAGRKAMAMSRSQFGNVQFGQRVALPSKESCSTPEGPVNAHPVASPLLGSVIGADEPAASLLSDGAKKQLDKLARYSKGGGRVLSEGEILNSLVEGVSGEMLVWMLKISTQRNEALVDVFRSELSLAKAERSKASAAAEKGKAPQSLG